MRDMRREMRGLAGRAARIKRIDVVAPALHRASRIVLMRIAVGYVVDRAAKGVDGLA